MSVLSKRHRLESSLQGLGNGFCGPRGGLLFQGDLGLRSSLQGFGKDVTGRRGGLLFYGGVYCLGVRLSLDSLEWTIKCCLLV